MSFSFPPLAWTGLDAKFGQLRARVAQRIDQTSERLTRRARSMAVAAGLFLSAAIMLLLALIVGLIALYKWGELHYGVFTGLALDACVLTISAAALTLTALWIAKPANEPSPVGGPVAAPVTEPARLIRPTVRADVRTRSSAQPFTSSGASFASADDLIEPLFVLLGRYLRWPVSGQSALDEMLYRFSSRVQAMPNEAIGRAAELVRHGDRATMLSVLGAAALFGWLMARAAPESGARHAH
jgi:hypothetical protein